MGSDQLKRWMSAGSALAGSLSSAAVSVVTGDTATATLFGAALGPFVENAVDEAAHRVLSSRRKERVGAVLTLASEKLLERYDEGHNLRGDPFMRTGVDGRASAEEVIEHVLDAAERAYEERKLPHIAAVLANTATSSDVDEHSAHYALRTIDSLNWQHLVALALIENQDTDPLPAADAPSRDAPWSAATAHHAFETLFSTEQLLTYAAEPEVGMFFSGMPELNGMRFTSAGALIYKLADLNEVSVADRNSLRRALPNV